jgi:hypothetical protein
VLIEGNIVELVGGPMVSPYTGPVAFGLNQSSQSGDTPWSECSRWTVRSNLFKWLTFQKVSLQEEYFSGGQSNSFVFTNNLLTPCTVAFFSPEGTNDVTITHNTVRNLGGGAIGLNDFFDVQARVNTNNRVRDNIGNYVSYGYNGPLATTWPGVIREHNYIIDNLSVGFIQSDIGATDVRVATDAAMGFVNITDADAGGDYHGYKLTVGSIGHNAATDLKDVGVDFALLDAALGGTVASGGGGFGGPFGGSVVGR